MNGSVVVAGWVGSTNLGDELVFRSLRSKLAVLDLSPTAISVDPDGTHADHQVEAVRDRDLPAVVRAVRASRGLVFGGGGLLQDETSPFNLPYHLARVALARAARRPVVGVGLGALGLVSRPGQEQVRRALANLPLAVRDAASQEALRGLGLEVSLAADLAVALPRPSVEPGDRFVVSLRPWSGHRSRLPVALRRGQETPSWFVDKMAAALDLVSTSTGLSPHFVAFQRDRDHPLHEAVAAAMRSPATFALPTVDTVVEEVATGRVVVSLRYHGGIAALLAGRPSVLVGYSDKVPALAGDAGPAAVPLAWTPEAVEGLPAAVDAALAAPDGSVDEALARLRNRDRANDRILERLA